MSSRNPVRPDDACKLKKNKERRGGMIEANEDEGEQATTKRRRDDDREMVEARKRSATKAQSADETSPERRKVEEDLAKFEEEAAKFEEERRRVRREGLGLKPFVCYSWRNICSRWSSLFCE